MEADRGYQIGMSRATSAADASAAADGHARIGAASGPLGDRQRKTPQPDACEQRYRALLENLADTVVLLDRDGWIEFISSAATTTFGYEPSALVGTHLGDLLGYEPALALLREARRLDTDSAARDVVPWQSKDGRALEIEVALTSMPGEADRLQGILRDVTAQRRVENQLLYVASHDFLTGLLNRRRFEEELERSLSRCVRHGGTGAVLWLDLDGFKDLNDTLGHRAGDELLVLIARHLNCSVRSESVAARLGGDEFAVLLPDADKAQAMQAAERLLAGISEVRLEVEGRLVRASASFGVVLYPEHGTTVDDVLARADTAMYHAKELGRGRCQLFEPEEGWRSAAEDRRVWMELVELALAEDSLVAYAQPIREIETDRTVACELLVRMADLEGSVIAPERFLPLAERTGVIVDIDLWIMCRAVEWLKRTPGAGFGLNVNVSPRTLSDPKLLTTLRALLADGSAEPERLTIEITETAIIVDILSARETLDAIKQLGCRISLDDFGSGFTSFLHLKQLPIDEIKIDGSFVERIAERPQDQHLVRAIVEMAKGLEMSTIAEFVDSPESLAIVRGFGVKCAQGYAIARPAPLAEMLGKVFR